MAIRNYYYYYKPFVLCYTSIIMSNSWIIEESSMSIDDLSIVQISGVTGYRCLALHPMKVINFYMEVQM